MEKENFGVTNEELLEAAGAGEIKLGKAEGTTEEGKRIRSGGIGDDNWKHRSQKMRCGTCWAFVLKMSSLVPQDPDHAIGRCRKHAPTLQGWPIVFSDDWCLDHKIDEDKL